MVIEIPIKNKMLCLVTCFHKKITMWDSLQKRGCKGPRLCILCKSDLESINLFLVNVYSFRKFGLILESFFFYFYDTWDFHKIEDNMFCWSRKHVKYKELPIFTIRGVGKAHNNYIF